MKNLSILLFMLLGLGIMMSCSDDDEAEPELSFAERFSGNWDINLMGSLEGALPLTVGDQPGMGTGVLPVIIDDFTVNYMLTTDISEDGALTIDMDGGDNRTGTLTGQLNEDGTGEGTYAMTFIDENGNNIPLAGDWTAVRN